MPQALLLGLALGLALPPSLEPGPGRLEPLLAAIRPDASERAYEGLPWHLRLEEALAQARAEGRPVLLWVMNGNPLGTV